MTWTDAPARPPTPRPGGRIYKSRNRRRRIFLIAGVAVLLLIAAVVGTVVSAGVKYNQAMARVDAFKGVTNRPPQGPGTNYLLVGSDTRSGQLPGVESAKRVAATGGQRSDVLILLHVPADKKNAYLISIPRDSYVNVPAAGPWQGGMTKINAAFAYGGLPTAVQTVEGLTGVRIDHVVLINFAGFQQMTDAVGGVNVRVNKTTYDPQTHATFKAGVNHLDGKMALLYVRQRYNLPGGDFDRERRQQQFLSALLHQATSAGTLVNPVRLNNFLDAATKSVVVDQQFSLTGAVLTFKGLTTKDLVFMTTPHLAASENVPGVGLVVRLDRQPALGLFNAVSKDTVGQWVAANPQYKHNVTSAN